uniref:BTB domain-containing protein n=1 Tax=Mycena chlorophos TaxID=658473 RepID=A0ABQ0LG22_MYCCL|nr:predicted protein [Mycena chlorophos]
MSRVRLPPVFLQHAHLRAGSQSAQPTTTNRDCPSEGCKIPVDIILRSSDGKSFGAHTKNLEVFTEGFPPADLANRSDQPEMEVVELPETSAILELFLKYTHNQRQPDLGKYPFAVVSGLAEAAEKYLAYSAMEVCRIQMRAQAQAHPMDVLMYASKHNYPDIRDAVAPFTLGLSLTKMRKDLAPNLFIAWVQYREHYLHAIQTVLSSPPSPMAQHKGGFWTCEGWLAFDSALLAKLGGGTFTLNDIRAFPTLVDQLMPLHLKDCAPCARRAQSWAVSASRTLSAAVPSFESCM